MMEEIKLNVENLTQDKKKAWKPIDEEEVYLLTLEGDVLDCVYHEDAYYSICMFAQGNIKKTREECKKLAKKREVQTRLEQIAEEYNEPIDWSDTDQGKYTIVYNYTKKQIDDYKYFWSKGANVYFSSREICKKAIEEIGEEDLKVYLGVEEEEQTEEAINKKL